MTATFDMTGRLRRIRADNARDQAHDLDLNHMTREDLVELYLRCVKALASRSEDG